MENLVEQIQQDLQRHKVRVKLPGERRARTLFLIMTSAETDVMEDLVATYGLLTEAQTKRAKELFASWTQNIYGVLMEKDGTMVYAFNRLFSDYDRENKCIYTKSLEEVLKTKPIAFSPGMTEEKAKEIVAELLSKLKLPRRMLVVVPYSEPGTRVIKYAAPEPRP